MQEDSLVETEVALKSEDPNGKFYGTHSSYCRYIQTKLLLLWYHRVSKGPQILHWKC